MTAPAAVAISASLPWYRQVTRTQWNAFFASFLGWTLDGFDFTIVSFVLADLQNSFSVSKAAVGAIGTVTLFTRVIGGIGAGTAADRWGRKGPLMFSVLWYSAFAFLSGFSSSFGMLLALRALFGIGMGGVWAAGMPLTLEHWPARLRGIASGMLQAGYSTGFIISALVFQFAYPLVNTRPDFGWRVMFWIGVLPALLVFFIMSGVQESPVWLERQRHLRDTQTRDAVSLTQLFRPDIIATTLGTSLMMTMFIFSYYSITFWYATFIISKNLKPVSFSLLLNIGGVTGAIAAGRLAETWLGRRGAATMMMLIGIAAVPLYVLTDNVWLMWTGAFAVGFFAAGAWGIVPSYLNERFPTAVRAVGAGFAYHVGAALGSFTPAFIGAMQDRGMTLASAMGLCIALAGVLVIATVWMGPETRGRQFHAHD
ncbi:MAG: MFS transporter [Acidobacteria bacterium]|nr:MFS transporter [Acidobacteriota bacterium]